MKFENTATNIFLELSGCEETKILLKVKKYLKSCWTFPLK
jgi:hypothetical protein